MPSASLPYVSLTLLARMLPMLSILTFTENSPSPLTVSGVISQADMNSSGFSTSCFGTSFGSGGFLPSDMVTYSVKLCCFCWPSTSR